MTCAAPVQSDMPKLQGVSFHHVGVACRDLEIERAHWTTLGYAPAGEVFVDPLQGVRLMFLEGAGPRVELIAPLPGSKVLDPYLTKGSKLYHFGYTAVDFDAAVTAIVSSGRQMSSAKPAVAFGGGRVAFFLLRNLMLVELIESLCP